MNHARTRRRGSAEPRLSFGTRRGPLRFLLGLLLFGLALGAYAFEPLPMRDSAVADSYAQWAKDTIERGQWPQALAGLERAADFADVSSDISYLLALARSNQNKSRRTILEALNQALYVNRWSLFDSETARLFKAEKLIEVRAYHDALAILAGVRSSPRQAVLTLRALAAVQPWRFFDYIRNTLDLYPRETGPVRVFFSFLANEHRAGRIPGTDELELLELVIRRLPALLVTDSELAWMAAPFMWDRAEAQRLVLAYRATNDPVPESIPAALRLAAIDEKTALNELFSDTVLDWGLLDEVWELLRSEEAIALFRRNLSTFSGVITEDADRDGIPETFATYIDGVLILYTYDAAQEGVPNLTVYFEAGEPRRASEILLPELGSASIRRVAAIHWERYPAILEVEVEGVRYIPRPFEFHYAPFVFDNLWNSGLLFPRRNHLTPLLTRRTLVFNALRVLRPSLEFRGGIEIVELNQGIPVRAREFVGDLMVAETHFYLGRPQFQRVDLTLSGRKDTLRRFSSAYQPMELEDLWDYNRYIEYTVTGVEWLND